MLYDPHFWIGIGIGAFLGANFGVLIMGLLIMSRDDERAFPPPRPPRDDEADDRPDHRLAPDHPGERQRLEWRR
jgi:hypothetical protein